MKRTVIARTFALTLAAAVAPAALAHPPHPDGTDAHDHIVTASREVVVGALEAALASADTGAPPANPAEPAPAFTKHGLPWQAESFALFQPSIRLRADAQWLWVESDGLPHAPFEYSPMVGIASWQQQVPLPQDYTGTNGWQIPLKAQLADEPVDGRKFLRRGAVALAVNGIPIFNALNNRGDDAFLSGELDEYGGHSGRGDDYHLHSAPLYLQKIVGADHPIAWALDGFPIYGIYNSKARAGMDGACPLGSTEPIDSLGGHFSTVPAGQGIDGGTRGYHYHGSKSFPYINGGMRGKVTVENDGVEPQPHAQPVREALPPMRGARIVGYEQTGPKAWSLTYAVNGKNGRVEFAANAGGGWGFTFVDPDGSTRKETFMARRGGGGQGVRGGQGGGGRGGRGDPGGGGGRGDNAPPRKRDAADLPQDNTPPVSKPMDGFVLRSAVIGPDGALPLRHTCDGDGVAPPFEWSGVPAGTRSLALAIHHMPPGASGGGDEHSYMVLWGIPPNATGIAEAQGDLGTWGVTSQGRRTGYAPPCSQGPGEKVYTATVYALSADPKLEAGTATFGQFLAAIAPITIGTADLAMKYARTEGTTNSGGGGAAARGGQGGTSDQGSTGKQGGRGSLLAQMTAFKTEVPEHDHDVVLVRPTRDSTTASVIASGDRIGQIEFWRDGDPRKRTTPEQTMKAGVAANFVMDGLKPDSKYRYRFSWRNTASAPTQQGEESAFETIRSPGREFVFAIQADSHLDQGVDLNVYERTLLNMREEGAEFLVDLGDTFMTDKRGAEWRRTEAQYDAQRYWFGIACRAMPLFMVLGNHDGERGGSGGRDAEMPAWSFGMRTARFPAPIVGEDGGMYTGRTTMEGSSAGNYYAFEWGDAQIVVLDPFWATTERIRGGGGGGNRGKPGGGGPGGQAGGDSGTPKEPLKPIDGSWASTLGREQYDWLDRTLAASKARHKFVFIHHLVGGMGGAESRGGAESAPYFEWGGTNPGGTDGFAEHRPGWPMPIHQLLVKRGVSAVFHGHDHLYVHSQRDGIQYQCVPQPGNIAGGTRSAEEYGYESGTILGSPGHVRVRVTPGAASVEFVRTAVPGAKGGGRRGGDVVSEPNGTVVDSYEVGPRTTAAIAPGALRDPQGSLASPQDGKPRSGGGRPAQGQGGKRGGTNGPPKDGVVKPAMTDTVHGSVYADNWFAMWINGKSVAVDSIDFLPHNVVSLDILPEYPMTIAILARDNADPTTGCEYGRSIGDGGLIMKFADGTVTDATWKATVLAHGPIDRDTANPKVRNEHLPESWFMPGFDDSSWSAATTYSQERIDPKQPFYEHDFEGASWIWSSDLDLDNTVLFRKTVHRPGWKPRWTTTPDTEPWTGR